MLIIDKNDKTAPVISNIQIQDIRSDSAVVTWNTDEESDSFVEYGIGSLMTRAADMKKPRLTL